MDRGFKAGHIFWYRKSANFGEWGTSIDSFGTIILRSMKLLKNLFNWKKKPIRLLGRGGMSYNDGHREYYMIQTICRQKKVE
jgi:hypothetical protein